MNARVELEVGRMPTLFLKWQCDERGTMFAALRRGPARGTPSEQAAKFWARWSATTALWPLTPWIPRRSKTEEAFWQD